MKKKMLYITTVFEDEKDGIWKKIIYNIIAYKNLGYEVDFSFRRVSGYVLVLNFGSEDQKDVKINEPHKDLFYYSLSKSLSKKYDLVYLRKPFGGASSLFLYSIFKKILRINIKTKFVMEIPTYPYEKEIRTFKARISEFLFRISKLSFQNHIDKIVYMGDETNNIWGRPCLRISNGIDLNHVKLLRTTLPREIEPFTFVGVARLSFWHGYDRIINSFKDYKGNVPIKLFIVGDGEPELTKLKNLVIKLNLKEQVFFLGALYGKDLDDVYLKSTICIDSLGRHRSGNIFNSSLKSKEYAAKGLPFIKSHKDEAFEGQNFVYDVSADENNINIKSIITWYKNLSPDTPASMRIFAEKNLSWDYQCKKVLESLE